MATSEMMEAILGSMVGEVETLATGAARGSYVFPGSFLGFCGHFPSYPVLPAVVQILAALALVRLVHGRMFSLAGVRNAKFRQEIRPDDLIAVECVAKVSPEFFAVRILLGDVLAASFEIAVEE